METRLTLFPSTDLFGVYVADPERPTNTISFRFYAHDAIPETRTPRAELGAGGRLESCASIPALQAPDPGNSTSMPGSMRYSTCRTRRTRSGGTGCTG